METRCRDGNTAMIFQFKSYYVVWKLIFGFFATNRARAFKSYYVVWKLSP